MLNGGLGQAIGGERSEGLVLIFAIVGGGWTIICLVFGGGALNLTRPKKYW